MLVLFYIKLIYFLNGIYLGVFKAFFCIGKAKLLIRVP